MSYLQTALKIADMHRKHETETKPMLVEKIKLPMTEARRESLMAVMEALWTKEFQGIISKVMVGRAKLADFKEATESWERICAEESESLTSKPPLTGQ